MTLDLVVCGGRPEENAAPSLYEGHDDDDGANEDEEEDACCAFSENNKRNTPNAPHHIRSDAV